MFVFVWIAFLLLEKSLCSQPEELVNSTELSSNGESSTVPQEETGTRNPTGNPVATNLVTKTSEGTNENHLECSNSGDCTSQLDSSTVASSKITWSPAVSLSITSKDSDSHSTMSVGISESETDVVNHLTTPDFYGTLNHNENELDFDVKDRGHFSTPIVDNNTMKTVKNLFDAVNVTHSSREISSVNASVPSENLEELTHLPTTVSDSLSEHLFKVSSPDNSQLTSSPASALRITSPSAGTVAQLDDTETKSVASSSAHLLFRSTRNTVSTDEMGNTTDHTVLDTESASSMQTVNTLVTTTIDPHLVNLNSKTNNSFETLESEESSLLNHSLNLTNAERSEDLILTTQPILSTAQVMDGHVSIQEVEASSGTSLLTTPQSYKEVHSDTLPPTLPEDGHEMQTSILPSLSIDVTTPLVYSLGHKVGTTVEPISLDSHTIGDVPNSSDTSSTVSHDTTENPKPIEKVQEGTVDNDLLRFNEISLMKGTTLLTEEKSSSMYQTTSSPDGFDEKKYFPTTPEIAVLLNTSVDHSVLQPTSIIIREEETTLSTILTTQKTNLAVTSVLEPQPSDSVDLTLASRTTFDVQPTSQSPSSMVDPTTLSIEFDHTTISSSTDLPSPSTNDKASDSNDKVSPRTLNETLFNIVDQVSSTTVGQSTQADEVTTSSSVVQSTPSSPVDHISSISVPQASHSTDGILVPSVTEQSTSQTVEQPASVSIIIDQQSSSTTDQSTNSHSVDQKSFSTFQESTASSAVYQSTKSDSIDQQSSSTFHESTKSDSIVQQPSSTFHESTSSGSFDLTTTVFISSPSPTSMESNKTLTPEIRDIDTSLIPEPPSSTTPPKTSVDIHVFPSMLSTSTIPNEELSSTTANLEIVDVIDPLHTTKSSSEYTSTATSNVATETHREGKHIPFSTESTKRQTVKSSNEVILVTAAKEPEIETTTIDLKEVMYNQLYFEDLKLNDKGNVITAVVQLPSMDLENIDVNVKIGEVHSWLEHVLMKEFQNWTRDPFDEIGNQSSDVPFGKVTLFYISPTPKTKSANITMTFIVHNQWRNETLPVDFVLSILNFYSADLRQSMNASSVRFYHGLLMDDSDLLPVILEKYGVIVFTTALAVILSALLICIVIVYRKRNRRSVHYLANSKLQHNMQESVGIDLTPAVVILQDEKKILNGNSKICDDEGWLVPIHEVPLAEDTNMPKVQDTKL